jgi:hypothetical protein
MALILFLLVGSCLSQNKSGVDQTVAEPRVQKILSSAQLSGALEYWGFCDGSKPRSEFPRLRPVSGHEGSARDVLREMFADDTKMQVTEDSDGMIRMVETDVPKDFLEVKIHHFSFPPDYHSGSGSMAVYTLLNAPEVIEFMKRNIGRGVPWEGWGMPGQIPPYRRVIGELNDVTVAQALDHIAHTFPGFWTYQNCHTAEGARKISVGFRGY